MDNLYLEEEYLDDPNKSLTFDEFTFPDTSTDFDHLGYQLHQRESTLHHLDLFNIFYPFSKLSEHLSAVKAPLLSLRLSSCHIISQECVQLAQTVSLRHVRSLDLSCNAIKLKGLMSIFQSPVMRELRKLEVYYCSVSA